jgi:hypothetical protein
MNNFYKLLAGLLLTLIAIQLISVTLNTYGMTGLGAGIAFSLTVGVAALRLLTPKKHT